MSWKLYSIAVIFVAQSTNGSSCADDLGLSGCNDSPTAPNGIVSRAALDCGDPDQNSVCGTWRGEVLDMFDPIINRCQSACNYYNAGNDTAVLQLCREIDALSRRQSVGFDIPIPVAYRCGTSIPNRWGSAADRCIPCDDLAP